MEKLLQFPAKHPYIWTTITIVFISLPGWLSDVWSLCSSEPLFDAIKRWVGPVSVPDISAYWITGAVGAAMFLWLIYELRQNRKVEPKDEEFPLFTEEDAYESSKDHIEALTKKESRIGDMDFDEQMDFVHSVVERQVDRQSARKAIQPKHDVWLRDVLWYIFKREWREEPADWQAFGDGELDSFYKGFNDLLQHAADGDIQIWGRNSFGGRLKKIPPEYWEDSSLRQVSVFNADPEEFVTEVPPNMIGGPIVYRTLKATKSEIEKIWQ